MHRFNDLFQVNSGQPIVPLIFFLFLLG